LSDNYEFFARCAGGFEKQLAAELRKLRIQGVRPLLGGVAFHGDLRGALRVCLWSRTASRVMLVLARIDASDADAFYLGLQKIDWTEHIGPSASIAVFAQGTNEGLRNSNYTALRAKDAICDQLRERRGQRPDVRPLRPDVGIQIALRDTKARVMLDLSGEALHRRGYREEGRQGAAPLKETLAASVLLASGWQEMAQRGEACIDPMCGSATLVIEAAMIAANMAPGLLRNYWGFQGWSGFEPSVWEELLAEARASFEAGLERMPKIIGCDIDGAALALSKANAKSAGLEGYIEFHQQDVSELSRLVDKGQSGLIVANPPYGLRISPQTDLGSLYRSLATGLEGLEGNWALSLLSPDEGIDYVLGLRPDSVLELYNGPLLVSLRQYRLEANFRSRIELREVAGGGLLGISVKEKNSEQFAARLYKVFKERQKWARRAGVCSYRIYDADLPDYAVAIDLYKGTGNSAGKSYLVIAEYAPPKSIDEQRAMRRFDDVLTIAPLVLGIPKEQVFSKTRKHEKGGGQYRNEAGKAYHAMVEEGPYRFELDLGSRLDTGLFLDHRITRALIGEMAPGMRFLNLFAYTGSASVFAAGGGAKSTTSVDLSQSYLAWAKRNMEANGFRGSNHRYVHADVLEWLDAEVAKGALYDLIFVDPPTFSNSKAMGATTWSVQRDHPGLLIKLASLLGPGGRIVFSCNLKNFKLEAEALAQKGISVTDISANTIPEDFKRSPRIHHCFILEKK